MGNTHQAGVKKDDHGDGGNQQLEVVSVLELQAGVEENQLQPLGGWRAVEATSMLENSKTNNCAIGGACINNKTTILQPTAESNILTHDDPLHPLLPEGVQFVLNTSRVNKKYIGDGDGFIAYEEKLASDTSNRDPHPHRIRMKGIDAPELKMKYGIASKNQLVKLIGGKRVQILVYGTDQYGRYLGDIYCDGIFIQEQMLKTGFAWHYKTCDKRPEFALWEREAKVARLGLWKLDNPQKPWDWRRDQRINDKKESIDDIQVESQSQVNGSTVSLPLLIMKDMEDLGRKWKESLQSIVSENMKLHDQVQELKRDKKDAEERAKKAEKEMESVVADNMKLNAQLQESERNKKDAEERAKKAEKEMESVVPDNMKLNAQLQESERNKKDAEERAKKAEKEMESVVADNMKLNAQLQESERNKKEAEDRVLQLDFFSGSVAAVNMDLHNKIEVLEDENKKAGDRAKEAESEMESVVAENRKLNDQLQVVEVQAMKLKYFSEKVAGVNMVFHGKLEELKKKNKMAEERAKGTEKEMKTILNDNMKLSGQIQRLNKINKEVTAFANSSKKKLQSVLAVNMDLDKKGEDRATLPDKGLETVGVENMKGKLQGISHKKSEQTVETPSATPTRDSGVKKPTVWRKKTAATTSSAPPPKGHCE